jgi:hypothetical protein
MEGMNVVKRMLGKETLTGMGRCASIFVNQEW